MKQPIKRWIGSLILAALVLAGSGCGTIKHHYPVLPLPEPPRIQFKDAGEHCISREELDQLTEYVLRLQGLAQKYRREIQIINGD